MRGRDQFEVPGSSLVHGWHVLSRICVRIASVLAAMAGLNGFWRCNTISFASTLKPYKSLVTAILLHGRETWTLLDDFEKKRRGPCFRNQVPEETSPQVLLVA